MEDDLAVVMEQWSPFPGVKVDERDLCSESVGLAACLNGQDVELRHFGGRQFSAVRMQVHVVLELLGGG